MTGQTNSPEETVFVTLVLAFEAANKQRTAEGFVRDGAFLNEVVPNLVRAHDQNALRPGHFFTSAGGGSPYTTIQLEGNSEKIVAALQSAFKEAHNNGRVTLSEALDGMKSPDVGSAREIIITLADTVYNIIKDEKFPIDKSYINMTM